jgi:hypothetical protein
VRQNMWVAAALRATEPLRRGRWGYSPAIALALAGVLFKTFQWYHSRPLWVDEEMVFLNIRDRTLSHLTGSLWLNQTAPLGWLALQRAIVQMFGTDDRAVRVLSVLFGIGTLTCATWVALRWMKPAGAALFVFLCGFAQWMNFYALEAKPYSTDAFWALLLPALAVWATETNQDVAVNLRRSLVWWITAIVGQWISYGAAFVAPACGVLLFAVAWQRSGFRRALFVALQGIPWLISFAAHYYLVMHPARTNAFLVTYWLPGLPPEAAGAGGALVWIAQQAAPLAGHPGGTSVWLIFWLLIGYGIATAFRNQPTFSLAWLLVILSAGLFAALRLVPLTDRIAFWVLPALYAPIAFAADDLVRSARDALTRQKLSKLALTGAIALSFWLLLPDMAQRSRDNLFIRSNNHGLNDKAAVHSLLTQWEPDDVLISTHLGLPALWWYAGVSIADPNRGMRYAADDNRILELRHSRPNSRTCRTIAGRSQLQRRLRNVRRAAIHLGFHSNEPPGFQELILDTFSEFSRLVSFKLIETDGAVAIFDLTSPPEPSTIPATKTLWRRQHREPKLAGCVAARPARRW